MGTKGNILIIVGDAEVRGMLHDMLSGRGYATTAAADGQTALNMVKKDTSVVVLIDLELNYTSCSEVMRHIKKRCPLTEFVVLTGDTTQASAAEGGNLGVHAYVKKPYDGQQLLMAIRRAFELQRVSSQLVQSRMDQRSRPILIAKIPLVLLVLSVIFCALTAWVILIGIFAVGLRFIIGVLVLIPLATLRARGRSDTNVLRKEWQGVRDWIVELAMLEHYRGSFQWAATNVKLAFARSTD